MTTLKCSRCTMLPTTWASRSYCLVFMSMALAPLRRGLVEELLYGAEQLHAVAFHHDGVRAFADFQVALVRRIGQLRKVILRHVRRRVLIPLGLDEQRRHADLRRIEKRL